MMERPQGCRNAGSCAVKAACAGQTATLTPDVFAHLISQEIANALGLAREGRHMRLLRPLVRRVTGRFAALVATFNADVGRDGFQTAAARFVTHFVEGFTVSGAEQVPMSGPLIVAANHPGVSDAGVIAAALSRADSRLVISDVPLIRALPHSKEAFIPVSADPDDHVRALRQMIEHLKGNGSVILFPGTYLNPDPEHEKGAAVQASFERWSPSIVLALRRVPDCRLQPAIVSGVIAPRFARHPLTRLVPAPRGWERQRMAEILQVMVQLRRGDRLGLTPHLTFGEPISAADLDGATDRAAAMAEIKARVGTLLEAHQQEAGSRLRQQATRPPQPRTQESL
jgi:hypothetical protein